MVFLSVCTALYDYVPRSEGELAIQEGDLVYILEKSEEDAWWKAKKKAKDDNEDEPVGLIPNNYVEEVKATHQAKALYDYTRQTDEELSFSEDNVLEVYDTSDPDWSLVGLNGENGFVPANYIEITSQAQEIKSPAATLSSPALPSRPQVERHAEEEEEEEEEQASQPNPAASLASIIGQQARSVSGRQPLPNIEASEEDEPAPSLPQRPISQQNQPRLNDHQRDLPDSPVPSPVPKSPQPMDRSGVIASPPLNRAMRSHSDANPTSPGGYHLYNVNEMVSVMGKQKKMPTTLGINLGTGVILIIPEKKRDGSQQEWTAEKLAHYSIEGKHVFLELVKPSKSIDFHAGAKDTAEEIVASLGELAGAVRAEGLREVIAAGTGARKEGRMLYDFMAQGDDEVTVADGDDVIVLDDTLSEEWWKVRRVKNGKEGVVPSSYVEITDISSPSGQNVKSPTVNSGRSTVDQNRLEEQRLARESMQASLKESRRKEEDKMTKSREVGPGLKLPRRASSLITGQQGNGTSQRDTQHSQSSQAKPDPSELRIWTDRSGSFKVEAQFIGLRNEKIHLHKTNGVKIAVPVAKMAPSDVEYVERKTGQSLDEDKPLSDLVKRGTRGSNGQSSSAKRASGTQQQNKSDYDWFDFFLRCGVNPHQCERYSANFNKDSMDESVLPDITTTVLRNLGLKEGDILRVMKYLDTKFNRTGNKQKARNVSFGGEEVIGTDEAASNGATSPAGLFSGPGGTLRNNTSKGRPAPAVQTNDTVDAKAFQKSNSRSDGSKPPPDVNTDSPDSPRPAPPMKDNVGFDDDAWDVKPQKAPRPSQSTTSPTTTPGASTSPNPPPPTLTGGMADLSLLTQPLKPVITHSTGVQPAPQHNGGGLPPSNPSQDLNQHQLNQPQGATPQFFNQLANQQTGIVVPNQLAGQPTGQISSNAGSRQRPQASQNLQQGGLMPPPPARPLSAPQNTSQANFGPPPLQPQLTGAPSTSFSPNQALPQAQGYGDMNMMAHQQTGQFGHPQQQNMLGFTQPQMPLGQPGINSLPVHPGFSPNMQLNPQVTGTQPSPFSMGMQQPGTGFPNNSIQAQPTGYTASYGQNGHAGYPTSTAGPINATLPPPLQPQNTSINTYPGSGIGLPQSNILPQRFGQQSPPPPPPIPPTPAQSLQPLQPQKTGPAPTVRFGVGPDAKKLAAQPTGRRANLSQATPDNPFGF